jgi:hypothetical protein
LVEVCFGLCREFKRLVSELVVMGVCDSFWEYSLASSVMRAPVNEDY